LRGGLGTQTTTRLRLSRVALRCRSKMMTYCPPPSSRAPTSWVAQDRLFAKRSRASVVYWRHAQFAQSPICRYHISGWIWPLSAVGCRVL